MKRSNLWIVGLVAVMAIAPAFAERVTFTPLEEFLIPVDMTADGSTMIMTGLFGGPVVLYTEADGAVQIGDGGCSGQVRISSDGSTIVGNERNADNRCEAARYNGTPFDWTLMGSEPGALPCGSSISSSYDTNNDTAVGLFWRAQLCRAIGGTWDVAAGMAGPELTSTVPNRPTRGNGITPDGSIIVGWQDAENGFRQAAKWVNGVQELITDDSGQIVGEALAVNSDGTAIVGAGWQGTIGGTGQGWLWREGIGMIPMAVGGAGRNIQSPALAVSDDGKTVVGVARDFQNFVQRGWIWTEKGGFAWLDDFVKGRGGRGWNLQAGSAMSADGKLIGGWGFDEQGQARGFLIERGAKGPQN